MQNAKQKQKNVTGFGVAKRQNKINDIVTDVELRNTKSY